jgi:hypothetical protein
MESPKDVVVGQKYMVPTIHTETGERLPVLFPAHEDGVEDCVDPVAPHYHIDYRFIDRKYGWDAYLAGDFYAKPYSQEWVALRACDGLAKANHFMIDRLHEKFEKAQIKQRVCPHRGVQLTNACGRCPAHGLVWNLNTGRLKFKRPFYVVAPDGSKAKLEAGRCVIVADEGFQVPCVLHLVDAEGQRYPNSEWQITYPYQYLRKGDTLTVSSPHCEVKPSESAPQTDPLYAL